MEQNYRYKMGYSPDYQGVSTEAALADFKVGDRVRRARAHNPPLRPASAHTRAALFAKGWGAGAGAAWTDCLHRLSTSCGQMYLAECGAAA